MILRKLEWLIGKLLGFHIFGVVNEDHSFAAFPLTFKETERVLFAAHIRFAHSSGGLSFWKRGRLSESGLEFALLSGCVHDGCSKHFRRLFTYFLYRFARSWIPIRRNFLQNLVLSRSQTPLNGREHARNRSQVLLSRVVARQTVINLRIVRQMLHLVRI